MKSLWFGYCLGLVWCVFAVGLLALASFYLPAVDIPWKLVLVAATLAVLGLFLLITWIRAYSQPVPTKKELGNEYFVGVMMQVFPAIIILLVATFLRAAIDHHRIAALFDPPEAAFISHGNELIMKGESYHFTKLAVGDTEINPNFHVIPGWVKLSQQGGGVLQISAVDPPDPDIPIGMDLPVSAPTNKPDWDGRLRVGEPAVGAPIYFPPATLEATFTDQLSPPQLTNITGFLLLPAIVPVALGFTDPDGWEDVTNSAFTVKSEPVKFTLVPADLSTPMALFRNDPLAAAIWMFPVLILYDLALVWAQRRGRSRV